MNCLSRGSIALLALFLTVRVEAEAPFRFAETPGKLPKTVVPQSYEIEVKPDVAGHTFTGSERVRVEVAQPTKTITLNQNELGISAAKLERADGSEAQPGSIALDAKGQMAVLTFPKEIAPGAWELALEFSGKINQSGQGLYSADYLEEGTGAKKTMLGTQMEATDARRLFPCWDEPAFRARFRMTAIVPETFLAISNMPVESETKTADGKKVRFGETPSMASYLVVLCAGELDRIEGEADGVKIGVVTTKGKAETGRYALESAEKILHYYDEYFGIKYPLPKLDLIAVPGGFGGAMENWGGIVFYESALLFDPVKSSERTRAGVFGILAHEMAHQWFGDLVTMAWWDNLWLNEGFASWMGTKCSDHFNPQWQVWLRADEARQRAMATDALASTHPIQQPVKTEGEANSAFDEITYQKGQSFLRMLETYLGEEDFRAGIRSYMKSHQFSNSTTADLWNALGEASKKNVAGLAASWTEQPGLPLVSLKVEEAGLTISQERFTIHQKNPAPLQWKIPITWREAQASDDGAAKVFLLEQKSALLSGAKGDAVVKLNADDVGYFRVQYEAAAFEKLLALAPHWEEADRVNLLSDSWALVEADRRPITDYFKLVEALRASDGLAQWEQIVRTMEEIDEMYWGKNEQPAFQEYARSILRPVFDRLGWEAQPNEETSRGLLRTELIGTLGKIGDAEVKQGAQARFEKFLADPATLPPDLRPVVFEIVGKNADAATWEKLHALGLKTKSVEEKGYFYGALAAAAAPDLAQKALQLSLTNELPAPRAIRLVMEVSRRGEHPELAWEFAKKETKALGQKMDALGGIRFYPGVARGFSDADRALELEAFAKESLGPEATREVAKAAEEIRFKSDLKARLLPAIQKWVSEKKPIDG